MYLKVKYWPFTKQNGIGGRRRTDRVRITDRYLVLKYCRERAMSAVVLHRIAGGVS